VTEGSRGGSRLSTGGGSASGRGTVEISSGMPPGGLVSMRAVCSASSAALGRLLGLRWKAALSSGRMAAGAALTSALPAVML
jgi:hypothetical protein